jgi:parvulin-like peptidyl-prolyl isomerase
MDSFFAANNKFHQYFYRQGEAEAMGVLTRMREVSPFIIGAGVIIFIGFMAFGDVPWTQITSGNNQNVIGTVNGTEIPYDEFLKRVQQMVDQQRQGKPDAEVDDTQIRQQVWDQMVQELLIKQEAERAGIAVSDQEMIDIMIDNPPDYLTQSFKDSTGTFDRKRYLQVITNPESIGEEIAKAQQQGRLDRSINPDSEVVKLKSQLLLIEKGIRESKVAENLQLALGLSNSIMSPTFVKQKYVAENSVADMRYIVFDGNSVPDKDVAVTPQEVEAYYAKNKQFYKQKPVRKLKYLAFNIVPSKDDSANTRKKINALSTSIQKVVTPEQKDSLYKYLIEKNSVNKVSFTGVQSLDPVRKAFILGRAPKDFVGPVNLSDGTYFFYIDSTRTGINELASVAHILIRANNNKDSAKTIANDVYKKIKGGADFAELARTMSQDPGSAQKGGVYEFFPKGRMVKPFEEASFNNPIGTLVPPVETEYGYHVIKVLDKSSDEISYSEFKFTSSISTATKNKIRLEAKNAKQLLENGQNIDSLAKTLKRVSSETPFFERSTPVLNSIALTDFAFSNDMNAVSEPRELKGFGIIVAQVSQVRTRGVKPIEDVTEEITAELKRVKRLDIVKKRADALYAKIKGQPIDAAMNADPSIEIRNVAQLKDNGSIPGFASDASFTAQVFAKPSFNKASEPIRGQNAYFIAQVNTLQKADEAKFATESKALYDQLSNQAKGSAYYRWFAKVKENADIQDFRTKFYND